MTDRTWISADGDLNVAGSYNPSGVPVNDDRLFVRSGLGVAPASNFDALIAVDLDLFSIGEGVTYNWGGNGTPFEVVADRITHAGTGKLWFKDGTHANATDLIEIRNGSADIDGLHITQLSVLRGTVDVSANATGGITRVEVGYMNNRATDARLTVATGAGTFTNLAQWGGRVTANNVITTADVYAGTLEKDIEEVVTANIYGGMFVYLDDDTITTLRLFGGTTDLRRASRPQTVTNRYWYSGAKLLYMPNMLTISTLDIDFREVA